MASWDPKFPKYFWWKPSKPWDESYTVTINAKGLTETQLLTVRSTDQKIQYATDVLVKGRTVLQCRDKLLSNLYKTALGASDSCDRLMVLPDGFVMNFSPEPFNVEHPDGSLTMLKDRVIQPPDEPRSSKDYRHLDEFQREQLHIAIEAYPGKKILILFSKGKEPRAYAEEFVEVFRLAHWRVEAPKPAPKEDNFYIDVAVSTDNQLPTNPWSQALITGFEKAGVKHAKSITEDGHIPRDWVVLWVGYKSPDGTSPDLCAPPAYVPYPDQHQPCEMIKQTPGDIPLPPGLRYSGMDRVSVFGGPANGTEKKHLKK